MKLFASHIAAIAELPDAVISFPCRDAHGREHTIELTNEAQQDLVMRLLATKPVESGTKPLRSLQVLTTAVSVTSQNRIGISLLLNPGAAVHCVLDRSQVDTLRQQLSEVGQTTGTKQ